jgi:hypothetical protein
VADENLVELEIAAFHGPHIKRARIVLAVGPDSLPEWLAAAPVRCTGAEALVEST